MLQISRSVGALFAAMSLALSACAAPAVGQDIELTGKLVLRGTAEFITPTVLTKEDGVWALEGLKREDASDHQNAQVRVRGKVTRGRESKAILPAVHVESLDVLKP
jgi:predicted small secreted protein